MPKALFTAIKREEFDIDTVIPGIQFVESNEGNDVYAIGDVRITVAYGLQPGDMVSRKVLGCHNAIRTGMLKCADRERALELVLETNAMIGVVGPDSSVEEVAMTLADCYRGVVISSTEAQVIDY